jgi:hypothetical protein
MQASINQANPQYSFNVETSGNAHTIVYNRAKFGAGIMLAILFPSMLLSFFFVMMTKGDMSSWVVCTVLLCSGTFLLLNSFRKSEAFSVVTDAAIIIKGKQYSKEHIGRFYIKAPGVQEEDVQQFTVTNPMHRTPIRLGMDRPTQIGMGAATAVAGTVNIVAQAGGLAMQSSKRSIQKHYRKINYSIGFMYGEKEIKLATGLSENTADVLLNKVLILM